MSFRPFSVCAIDGAFSNMGASGVVVSDCFQKHVKGSMYIFVFPFHL